VRTKIVAVIFCAALLAPLEASALIMTGLGNSPVQDPGWPEGSLAVANQQSRVGWWEGPPDGGGQWQFLYRGDTEAFNGTLLAFCGITNPGLEIVLHDGPKESEFLKEPANTNVNLRVHWTFTVWDSAKARERQQTNSPRLDLYLGEGSAVTWTKVHLPWNVKIYDERASAKDDAKSSNASDLINAEGQITISDGSSYYTFNKDKTFVSRPVGMSGRCFDGTWTADGDNPCNFTIAAKMRWMNGFNARDEYRKIVFWVYPGRIRIPVERTSSVPNNELFEDYFLIEEITKIEKPVTTQIQPSLK
jgi:hypothetical protein